MKFFLSLMTKLPFFVLGLAMLLGAMGMFMGFVFGAIIQDTGMAIKLSVLGIVVLYISGLVIIKKKHLEKEDE